MQENREALILILADLGTDHRCFKISQSLLRFGFKPTIYCDKPLTELTPEWKNISVQILSTKSHYHGFLSVWLLYLFRITPILFFTRSPLWIIEDGGPLFWAAWIGFVRRKTVIYDAREILLETPMIKNRPSRKFLWSIWLKLGMLFTSKILTVSPLFVKYYGSLYPRKTVRLLPNVPELKVQSQQKEKWDRDLTVNTPIKTPVKLIYQGSLRSGSGLKQIIHALSKTKDYTLDVYGFGPEAKELSILISELKIEDRIYLHGKIPFSHLPEQIAKADIGIHLLEPLGMSFDYTLSNKIFDYLHESLPVLLGPTTAHKKFLGENSVGICIDNLATGTILEGLNKIRSDYLRFQFNSQETAKKWHWKNFDPNLMSMIPKNLLNNQTVTT